VTAPLAAALAGIALTLFGQGAANADTGFKSIVCGGEKYMFHDDGSWQTNASGGYIGEGCGAGIDWIDANHKAGSDYYFGVTDGSDHQFEAWIPTVYATAHVSFDLVAYTPDGWTSAACPGFEDPLATRTIDEAPVSGFQKLFTLAGAAGCQLVIHAQVNDSYDLNGTVGLDAISSHAEN
jgi:hypothetical protein